MKWTDSLTKLLKEFRRDGYLNNTITIRKTEFIISSFYDTFCPSAHPPPTYKDVRLKLDLMENPNKYLWNK